MSSIRDEPANILLSILSNNLWIYDNIEIISNNNIDYGILNTTYTPVLPDFSDIVYLLLYCLAEKNFISRCISNKVMHSRELLK